MDAVFPVPVDFTHQISLSTDQTPYLTRVKAHFGVTEANMMFHPLPPPLHFLEYPDSRQHILISLFTACDFLMSYGTSSQPDLEPIPSIFQFSTPYSHIPLSWNVLVPVLE